MYLQLLGKLHKLSDEKTWLLCTMRTTTFNLNQILAKNIALHNDLFHQRGK